MTEWGTQWQAAITPGIRCVWYIAPHKGLTGISRDYVVLGSYARAERKAQRILRRLRRADDRIVSSRIIT